MTPQAIDRSPDIIISNVSGKRAKFSNTLFPRFRGQALLAITALSVLHLVLQYGNLLILPAISLFLCLCAALFLIYRTAVASMPLNTAPNIIMTLGLALVLAFFLGLVEMRIFGLSKLELIEKGIYYFLLLSAFGGIFLAFSENKARQGAMAKAQQLEKTARESQLKTLRYQLNPHFIFNALNSVSSLVIDNRNKDAEFLVDALSDYMRTVLDADSATLVPLTSEIEQQQRYLEIEKVRFPSRLSFDVDISREASKWEIPVLILQPLIENAIKHGVAEQSGPVHIAISAKEEDERLKLSVFNTGRVKPRWSGLSGTGTGLENVRGRLQSLYGDAASLEIGNSTDCQVIAVLTIPKDAYLFQENSTQ